MSKPAARAARTASPGMFSLARKLGTARVLFALRGQRVDALVLHYFRRVREGGADILILELRVVGKDLLVRPRFGEEVDQQLDGDARARDDGLVHEHLRVNGNSVAPIHVCVPS